MLSLIATLFVAGVLTILLPCILPLLPIVLGVSVAGRSKWRPLLIVSGMLVSFVGFTFLLQVVLSQFVEFADTLRIATYYVLLLFGLGFVFQEKSILWAGAILGSLFFWNKGPVLMGALAALGVVAMEVGGRVATAIQQFGTNVQQSAQSGLGRDAPLTAFIIGLTLGLVWVPCAGPALSFALTAVREQPGPLALLYLAVYGLGTAIPLVIVGYGGQAAVHTVKSIVPYTGVIKRVAGVFLILTAIALRYDLLTGLQTSLGYGSFVSGLEDKLFNKEKPANTPLSSDGSVPLPKLSKAPEFTGISTWINSKPLTMAELKGKVVLIDFWTYSCINCIRTLPYIQGYWEKYKDAPFVLVGVHTPEFTFEKSTDNVKQAMEKYGLTYPVAQDNDFGTWNAFANRYWPAKYLIDADGYVRYTHFGEGDYEETDKAIESLLKEINPDMPLKPGNKVVPTAETPRRAVSPETYLGVRSWPSLGNKQGEPATDVVTYTAPSSMKLHQYYLVGDWQLQDDGEYQLLKSPSGEIRMQWRGSEINLVLGLADGTKQVQAESWIDGVKVKDFTIDQHDLYNLYKGDYGEHELILKLKSTGVEAYAFTFGSN